MREKGFSLIELLVVMVIILIVLSSAFNMFSSSYEAEEQQSLIAEKHMDKLIGFEILRRDLQNAGYCLPKGYASIDIKSGNLTIRSSVANIDLDGISDFVKVIYYNGTSWEDSVLGNSSSESRLYCIVLSLPEKEYKCNGTCSDIIGACSGDLDGNKTYIVCPVDNSALEKYYNEVVYYLSEPKVITCGDASPCKKSLMRREYYARGGSATRAVMDCVCSFFVRAGVDENGDGNIDEWKEEYNGTGVIKAIFVALVYQEGKKEREIVTSVDKLEIPVLGFNESLEYNVTDKHYRYGVLSAMLDILGNSE